MYFLFLSFLKKMFRCFRYKLVKEEYKLAGPGNDRKWQAMIFYKSIVEIQGFRICLYV